MTSMRVGVQIQPQQADLAAMRDAWLEAEALGDCNRYRNVEAYKAKNEHPLAHCAELGRDPAEIERT
jgi:hypothetical protein